MKPDKSSHFMTELLTFEHYIAHSYLRHGRLRRFKAGTKGWDRVAKEIDECGMLALQASVNMRYLVQEWSRKKFGPGNPGEYVTFLDLLNDLEQAIAFKNLRIAKMTMYTYKQESLAWTALNNEIEEYGLKALHAREEILILLGYAKRGEEVEL